MNEESRWKENAREGLSPAESSPRGNSIEVHSGADSVNMGSAEGQFASNRIRVTALYVLSAERFVPNESGTTGNRLLLIISAGGFLMGFIQTVKKEINVIRERDPAIHSNMEVFLYPSFRVLLKYRRAHKHYLKGHYFRARWISQRAARKTGIEIHPGATIGEGLFIDHGNGVIIGETTIIGDNCTLYQGVTLGGTGKEQGKRHPTLGNNVMVSAGAKVLGSFTIGDNSKIGAGSVVLEEVPPNSTVVGVPGHVVKRDNIRLPQEELDQTHLPDPVEEEIAALRRENAELIERVLRLEQQINERMGG